MDPLNQNNMFVGSDSAGVARSTDRGATWALVNSGLADLAIRSIDCSDGQNLLVGTLSGKVFRTSNGGGSWENSSAGLGTGEMNGLVIDRTNPNIVYVSTNYQGKGVYKSTDGGRTWRLKSKGFTGSVGIFAHPSKPSTLYAPTYGGIHVTSDGAESWSFLPSNGLGALQGFAFLVNPGQQNTLYVGTNRGVYIYGRTVTPGGPLVEFTNPAFAKTNGTVTLTGSGFGPTQGTNKVMFGNVPASTVQLWSDSKVTVKVPAGAQTGSTVVTTSSEESNPVDFVVPANSGKLTPTTGTNATRVTLTLTARPTSGFVIVLFGANPATEVQVLPPNIVTCLAPPGTGTVPIAAYVGSVRNLLGNYTYQNQR
jgi:hypothetical protein